MRPRILAGLTVLATATLAADGRAFPEYRRYFQVTYGKLVPCELCHSSGGGTERNGYGRDWQRHKEDLTAFKSIEALDSDGDGISNGDEIRQGSNPGDEASTPAHPLSYWTNPRGIPIPREQIALVIGHSDSIEASEPALSDAQAHLVETRAKTSVRLPDRYPTLYFGVNAGARSNVALFRQYDPAGDGHFSLLVSADARGKVEKAVLFRAGKSEGAVYRGYLDCVVGHSKDDVPAPGRDGCPSLPGKEASLRATADAVRSALFTLDVLLGDARSVPASDGAPSLSASAPADPSPPALPATSAAPEAPETGLDLTAAPASSRVSSKKLSAARCRRTRFDRSPRGRDRRERALGCAVVALGQRNRAPPADAGVARRALPIVDCAHLHELAARPGRGRERCLRADARRPRLDRRVLRLPVVATFARHEPRPFVRLRRDVRVDRAVHRHEPRAERAASGAHRDATLVRDVRRSCPGGGSKRFLPSFEWFSRSRRGSAHPRRRSSAPLLRRPRRHVRQGRRSMEVVCLVSVRSRARWRSCLPRSWPGNASSTTRRARCGWR